MANVCIIVSVVEFMVERRQTPNSSPKLRGMYRRPALRYVFEQKMCLKNATEGEWVPQNVYNKALRIERSLLRKYRRHLRNKVGQADDALDAGSGTSASL